MVEGKLVVKEEELLQLYEVKRKMDRKVDEQANCIESLNVRCMHNLLLLLSVR